MNRFFLLCIISTITAFSLRAVTVVQGDSTASPYAFTVKVNTQAFDPITGQFFVGLQADAINSSYALSRSARPTFQVTEMFGAIGSNSALTGREVDLLTIAPQPNSAPFLPLVLDGELVVQITTPNGSPVETSSILNDAAGATIISQIDSLASSPTTIFAAVSPNSGNPFLSTNSGIAVLKIVTVNNALNSLQTKDATTGLDGNLAAPLSVTSSAITGGTSAVTAQNSAVSLFYDQPFDRLYIGLQVTSATASGNVANSVVVGYLNSSNILTFFPIAPATALASGTDGIVIIKSGGSAESVSAFEPKLMHTSTGPDYLIVNGGPNVIANVGNTVYALPLVNLPSSPTIHGTAAKYNAPLTNGVFTVPATAPGDLRPDSDPEVLVGAGALPTPSTTTISDIQVHGDTVYVALNTTPGSTTDTGLFSSQALFDATGAIVRWTPWQYHLVPLNAFPTTTLPGGATDDGGVKFFTIDQQSSNVWIVEGTTDQTAGVTNWNQGFSATDIVESLNDNLSTGAYSVLDLPYHTNGFNGATNYRYTLFGGNGTATFIVTSQKNSTQEIPTTNFSTAGTILTTPIPGTARTLEYSRQVTGATTNYFFAGTEQGLFAFADSAGNGFDVSTLASLNAAPFSTRSWNKITTIAGEPLAIKSSGNGNLYVLTRTLTSNPLQPFTNTVYSIPFATTTAAMFAPGNIRTVAQTGMGVFASTVQFFDAAIIATGALSSPGTKEQLVLATNQGLYYSNADQTVNNGIINATNQASANWTIAPTAQTTLFTKIQSPNTPTQTTLWPLSVQDASGLQTFDNGSVNQLSASGNAAGTAVAFSNGFLPTNFNNSSSTPSPFTLFGLPEGLWSDGNRRMIITKNSNNPSTTNNLYSSPLNLSGSNLTAPLLLQHPVVDTKNHFYWISQIGSSGQLLAGTDQGVIALS